MVVVNFLYVTRGTVPFIKAFYSELEEEGIEQTMAPRYSPNLNGTAERVSRTVVESARSMPQHAGLSKVFWAEAFVHAARIRNYFPVPRNVRKSSQEFLTGQKPDVRFLRTFGCLGWYHVPKEIRKKLDPKSIIGIVISWYPNKLYKFWLPSERRSVITRDVTIIEDRFPAEESDGLIPEKISHINEEVEIKNDHRTSDIDESDSDDKDDERNKDAVISNPVNNLGNDNETGTNQNDSPDRIDELTYYPIVDENYIEDPE